MNLETAILGMNVASTWFMAGLIAFVHFVQYPMFTRYRGSQFREAMLEHQRRTLFVVALPMILEGATSILLLFHRPEHVATWSVWLGLALVALNTASTALLQMPCHIKLERDGYDANTHRRLVRGNLIRVFGWWGRAILGAWWLTK